MATVVEAASQPAIAKIRIQDVRKSYPAASGETCAVDNVSLEVETGQFVALLGPSGCGKSTILNLVAGLDTPDRGSVLYDGVAISEPHSHVGYLTQDDALLPWRNVLANVALPLEIRKEARPSREASARAVLERVGLTGFERHYPHQLSGGMRKRASLARNLVYQPETLLLDEPFSALDAHTRSSMQREMLRLVRDANLTVLLVTHDLVEAIALADKIILFSKRPARVLETFHLERKSPETINHFSPDDEQLQKTLWRRLSDHDELVIEP